MKQKENASGSPLFPFPVLLRNTKDNELVFFSVQTEILKGSEDVFTIPVESLNFTFAPNECGNSKTYLILRRTWNLCPKMM